MKVESGVPDKMPMVGAFFRGNGGGTSLIWLSDITKLVFVFAIDVSGVGVIMLRLIELSKAPPKKERNECLSLGKDLKRSPIYLKSITPWKKKSTRVVKMTANLSRTVWPRKFNLRADHLRLKSNRIERNKTNRIKQNRIE